MKHLDVKEWISATGFLLISCMAMAQAVSTVEKIPPVILENTERRALYSDMIGQEYDLFILLPADYHSDSKVYPVIVGLDPFRSIS